MYAALAGLIRAGEWTTYGDIGIAAHGVPGFARHVGRAAATADGFPHAERVLASGGRIAAGWRTETGEGPEACRERLEEQGVTFFSGRADPARHVGWEELLARADEAGIECADVIG
jgi:alkylated DNA nucleotide flippase Atl1